MGREQVSWKKAWTDLEKELLSAEESFHNQRGKKKEEKLIAEIIELMNVIKKDNTKSSSSKVTPSKNKKTTPSKRKSTKRKKKKESFSDKVLDFFGLI